MNLQYANTRIKMLLNKKQYFPVALFVVHGTCKAKVMGLKPRNPINV